MQTNKIFLVLILLISSHISFYGQTISKKWNSINNQYDFTNERGDVIAYEKYNTITQSWDYTRVDPRSNINSYNSYTQPINLPLINQVLSQRQERYDYNFAAVKSTIRKLGDWVKNSSLPNEITSSTLLRYDAEIIAKIQARDWADTNLTNNVIRYLETEIRRVLNEEIDSYNLKRKNVPNLLVNQGGYQVSRITEKRWDENKEDWVVVRIVSAPSYLYIDGNRINFLRSDSTEWKYNNVIDPRWANEDEIVYTGSHCPTIYFDKNFKYIAFVEGDNSYLYDIEKKDNTIRPD